MSSLAKPLASRARVGVGLLFFVNAVAFASIVPRYIDFRDAFSLDNAAFGLVIAAGPVGSLAAGLIAGRLVRRIGSGPTAVASSATLGLNLLLVSVASDAVSLAVALFVAGVLDGTGDIANNAHGMRVQRILGRSVISGLHGVWSIGAIVGGISATLAATNGISIGAQLVTTGIIIAVVSVSAGVLLRLPEVDTSERASTTATASHRFATVSFLAILGVAFAGAMLEDTVSTWGGIYLVDVVGIPEVDAGIAFIVFMTALTLGRLTGDGAIDRWGSMRVLTVGAGCAAAGMLLVLLVPTLWASLTGFSIVGIGIATMIPTAMHAADETRGLRPGAGLTLASIVMRVGFLIAPPTIGILADATTLRMALLVAPIIALSVIALARVVSIRDSRATTESSTTNHVRET